MNHFIKKIKNNDHSCVEISNDFFESNNRRFITNVSKCKNIYLTEQHLLTTFVRNQITYKLNYFDTCFNCMFFFNSNYSKDFIYKNYCVLYKIKKPYLFFTMVQDNIGANNTRLAVELYQFSDFDHYINYNTNKIIINYKNEFVYESIDVKNKDKTTTNYIIKINLVSILETTYNINACDSISYLFIYLKEIQDLLTNKIGYKCIYKFEIINSNIFTPDTKKQNLTFEMLKNVTYKINNPTNDINIGFWKLFNRFNKLTTTHKSKKNYNLLKSKLEKNKDFDSKFELFKTIFKEPLVNISETELINFKQECVDFYEKINIKTEPVKKPQIIQVKKLYKYKYNYEIYDISFLFKPVPTKKIYNYEIYDISWLFELPPTNSIVTDLFKNIQISFNKFVTFENEKLLKKMLIEYYISNNNFQEYLKNYNKIFVTKDIHYSTFLQKHRHFNIKLFNATNKHITSTLHANISNNNAIVELTQISTI